MTETNINELFKVLKLFHEYFPKTFLKTGMERCGHCGGTGLKNNVNIVYCELCEFCHGLGFRNVEDVKCDFVCKKCRGSGYESTQRICSKCNGRGLVDWVRHITNSRG